MYVKRAAVTSVSAGGRKPAAILSSLVAAFNVVSAATPKWSRGWAPIIILNTTAPGRDSLLAGHEAGTHGAEHTPV